MRGPKAKPAPAESTVIKGPFPGAKLRIEEPDWARKKFPGPEGWGAAVAEIAKAKWQTIVTAMTEAKTLSPANESAIEMLAVAYATWRLAQDHVAENGPIVAAPRTGVPMQNPYVAIANRAAGMVIKIEAELGIPPTMRSRTSKAPAPSGPNLFERWEQKRLTP